jgi:Na+/citrate or Na+/malate symporter
LRLSTFYIIVHGNQSDTYIGVRVMVFNATFNNISAISWGTVLDLLVEDKSYTYTNESSIRIKKYIAKLKKKKNNWQPYQDYIRFL